MFEGTKFLGKHVPQNPRFFTMPCLYILEKGPDPSFDETHEISYTLVYMLYAKIYLNWSGSFGENDFQILSVYFYFQFHLKRDVSSSLNIMNSLYKSQ